MRRAQRYLRTAPLLSLLLTLTGLATPLRASQEPADAQPGSTPVGELRRVLHLRGGGTLRAVTRLGEGVWEYKSGSSWQGLPLALVERAESERELLSSLRSQRSKVGKKDLAGRASLVGWMLDEGLLQEGLQEADVLLALDRENETVRTTLARHAAELLPPTRSAQEQPIEVACAALIQRGAPLPASLRELVVLELEALGEPEALRASLLSSLHDSSLTKRSFSALALRRLFRGEELRPLMQRAVLDSAETVRQESALALRAAEEPALVVPIVRAMESSLHPAVRRNAAEALGLMSYPAAVPALVSRLAALQGASSHSTPHSNIFIGRQKAFIQDFDVEVAQFQAVADPGINVLVEGQATDAGVAGVQEFAFASERRVIQGSLGRITGEDPGNLARDWLKWWEANSSRFDGGQSLDQRE